MPITATAAEPAAWRHKGASEHRPSLRKSASSRPQPGPADQRQPSGASFLPGIVGEVKDIVMALASLLNTHLVEPQKRRLIARGHAEGRVEGWVEGRAEGRVEGRVEGHAEGRVEGRVEAFNELRPLLRERGIELDDLILHKDEEEETDADAGNRC